MGLRKIGPGSEESLHKQSAISEGTTFNRLPVDGLNALRANGGEHT